MSTLREIADKCGVSAMTVSAVLNKRRGAAGPEVRDRILKAVAETGYRAGKRSRTEQPERRNVLGVLMAYCDCNAVASDRYFGPILDGVFEQARRQEQGTLLYVTEDPWEKAIANTAKYFGGRCDGVILMLPLLTKEVALSLANQEMPFVLVGESRTETSLSVVDLDNIGAGYAATNHLLEAGHRRIAHFCGDATLLSSSQREQGFRQALADWGLPIDETLILPGKYNIPSGYRRMTELLTENRPDLPTAAFCADDWIALGVMQAVIESGRKVPDDFSVVGVNNNREGIASQPPLTTIHNPLVYIGQGAVDLMLGQIRDGVPPGEKSLLRGELISRGSVTPPAGSRNAW